MFSKTEPFVKSGVITCNKLEEVFAIGNSPKWKHRAISVGDVVHTEGLYLLVTGTGYKGISKPFIQSQVKYALVSQAMK